MLGNKKLTNQSVLIEEFIDGKMYTIDYYVDEDQHITMSKPVFVKL
jgi:phosphoribosylamine-glycine ligase